MVCVSEALLTEMKDILMTRIEGLGRLIIIDGSMWFSFLFFVRVMNTSTARPFLSPVEHHAPPRMTSLPVNGSSRDHQGISHVAALPTLTVSTGVPVTRRLVWNTVTARLTLSLPLLPASVTFLFYPHNCNSNSLGIILISPLNGFFPPSSMFAMA